MQLVMHLRKVNMLKENTDKYQVTSAMASSDFKSSE